MDPGTWFGNDGLTLILAVPLLVFAIRRAVAGSARGLLLWCGVLAYNVYNYAFYLFGARLNAFLPVYVITFVLSVITLGFILVHMDVSALAERFRPQTPVRVIGGYLLFVAGGLTIAWLGMWASYSFGGRPTPVDPEAFKVVAALDLSLIVPGLAAGGLLLWKRQPWGFVIATTATVQGALYLLVLTINSVIAIEQGLARCRARYRCGCLWRYSLPRLRPCSCETPRTRRS